MLTRADLSHGLFTRRHATRILVATLGAAAAGSFTQAQTSEQPKEEAPCTSANQARTAIHYDLDFKASPQHFYETLLTSKQFAVFSGMPATIDATEGGAFSMFGGLIVGRNVELVPNQRIVQAWRPSHWDAGLYSIVRFEFKPGDAETNLAFDHIGFPSGDYDHLDWGWKNHYWEPLKKYFA
jgi:activator of HSP90 ATPase